MAVLPPAERPRAMRSPLGRVRGLGASGTGVGHWRVERITAVALVPLTIWFILAILSLLGADQPAVAAWVARPWNTTLLLALIALTFHHAQLGLQVVFEDYIHGKLRLSACILATQGAALLLGLMAAVAVLRLALGGASH